MKIQSLAIMFIILILPMSMILASYTESRVTTINLQSKYDSKLKDATYDALKAYQINSLNSDTSDYTNSKMRDINASVNTFFNSIATNFSTAGYTKTTLQSYVPAIVYTMYDGYYIYSPYTNTWGQNSSNLNIKNEMTAQIPQQSSGTYKEGENLYGLKPYVYYSCRYIKGNLDVVITYSLDNYISIQGSKDGKPFSKYGYVLDDVTVSGENVMYKGISIDAETALTENIFVDGELKNLPYIRKNGTKYYKEGNKIFSVLNGKSIVQQTDNFNQDLVQNININAKQYYKEANELKEFMQSIGLDNLKVSDAVNIDGTKFSDDVYQNLNNGYIFDFGSGIEEPESNFNTHRRDVIKYSIERNLSIAISNYNNYSGSSANFQMPKLKETDWDIIMNNISIISFLQGLSIGGKIYNGYSVINNTKNSDVVSEDSIYIKTMNDSTIHRVTEKELDSTNAVGIYNINLERKSGENTAGVTKYYFPVQGTLSYDSIVTQNKISENYNGNIYEYLSRTENKGIAKIYYTALAREKYGMYRPKLQI